MRNKLRILLLSATMFLTFGFAFAQSKLGVIGIAGWPDTAHCLVPYSNMRVYVVNNDSSFAFNGTVNIYFHAGLSTFLLDSGSLSIAAGGIDSLIVNNYYFSQTEYAAGHDVVIVWPIALNGNTIADSLTDSVYYDCNAGVPYYKEKKGFSLFPDPANEMLFIKSGYPSNEINYISLIDIAGKELKKFNSATDRIPLDGFERGMYFIEVKLNNGQTITSKFVKD